MKIIQDQRGITLIEVLVSLGIMGSLITMVGAGVFQIIKQSGQVGAGYRAQAATRGPVLWLNRDLPMAQSTSLVDGAAAVGAATFTWTDYFGGGGVAHSLSYEVSGDTLNRNYDGNISPAGRRIASAGFSRSGRLITVTLTSLPEGRFAVTDQKTINVQLRANG